LIPHQVDAAGAELSPAIARRMMFELRKRAWTPVSAEMDHEQLARWINASNAVDFDPSFSGFKICGVPIEEDETVPAGEIRFVDDRENVIGRIIQLHTSGEL
jgi:hypothetical protein